MNIFNHVVPTRVIDITNYSIRSTVISSKSSCFEIAFEYEVHTISVQDEKTKCLWLIALRSSFIKYNSFNEKQYPPLIVKEPLSFFSEDVKMTETIHFVNQLLTIPSNRICADCLSREITFVDLDYGVFLCVSCSQMHLKLNHSQIKGNVPIFHVKQLSELSLKDVEMLQVLGNLRGNGYYLKHFKQKELMSKQMLVSASNLQLIQYIKKKYKLYN